MEPQEKFSLSKKGEKFWKVQGEQDGHDVIMYDFEEEEDDIFRNPLVLQSFSSPDCLDSYHMTLINDYKNKRFKLVYGDLQANELISFITKKLAKFYKKELKIKKSKKIIRTLHSIYSLNLNERAIPKVYANILSKKYILSSLFNAKLEYSFGSLCFLIKKIAANILSELFNKSEGKEWANSFLTKLTNMFDKSKGKKWENSVITVLTHLCCKCFWDFKKKPFIHFYAIATFFAVGIETLPKQFFPSLEHFFKYMCKVVSRNNLSNHCVSTVWDELMVFCEHWIKYSLSYPFLKYLDPSLSKIKFDNCIEPVLSILNNSSPFFVIRNKMRYEYAHIEGSYVPCEYPVIPSFPMLSLSNEQDEFFSFGAVHLGKKNIVNDIIGLGYCEECKLSNCSCELNCTESDMEIDETENVSLAEQNNPSDLQIIPMDSEQWLPMEFDDVENISLLPGQNEPSYSGEPQLWYDMDMEIDGNENVSIAGRNKPSHPEEPQLWFDCSDSMDVDINFDYYDSLIKYNTSYLFSDSRLKVWENITLSYCRRSRKKSRK